MRLSPEDKTWLFSALNKPEAARRQIDAAIRMLFSGEDPVAVHTLAMAGFEFLEIWLNTPKVLWIFSLIL